MQFRLQSYIFASLLTCSLVAQSVTTGFPDLNPAGSAGSNAIPFSTYFGATPGSWTELTVLPVAELQSKGLSVGASPTSIAFAASGTGTLNFPQIRVTIGHLNASPMISGFAGALAGGSSLINNLTTGSVSWNCVANTWSPLWSGTTPFAWDGVRDVGVLVTVSGTTCATTTGWNGTFRRESVLQRMYASGWNAFSPTNSAINALKSRWTWTVPATPGAVLSYGYGVGGSTGTPLIETVGQPLTGNTAFALHVSSAYIGAPAVLAMSNAPTYMDIGVQGLTFPLLVDPTPGTWLGVVPGVVDGSGAVEWNLPIPAWSSLVGASVALQAIVFDPSGVPTAVGPATATGGMLVTIGG